MGSVKTPFTILDRPLENLRPIKVRVIGAGYSGIYLGIRIPERIRNVDLQIYEKNDGIGGTWWENRYPGCACDIPGKTLQSGSTMSTVLTKEHSPFIPILFQSEYSMVRHLCSSSRDPKVPTRHSRKVWCDKIYKDVS
jgi:hypothetical protein